MNWDSAAAFFHDIRPPLFDQFRVTIVADEDGHCFNGYMTEGSGGMLTPSSSTLVAAVAAVVMQFCLHMN